MIELAVSPEPIAEISGVLRIISDAYPGARVTTTGLPAGVAMRIVIPTTTIFTDRKDQS